MLSLKLAYNDTYFYYLENTRTARGAGRLLFTNEQTSRGLVMENILMSIAVV